MKISAKILLLFAIITLLAPASAAVSAASAALADAADAGKVPNKLPNVDKAIERSVDKSAKSGVDKSLYEKATIILISENKKKRLKLKVDLAKSEAARERGMMFMHSTPKNYAMLFDLEEPQPVSMWMKDCYIALDIFFIDDTGRIFYIKRNTMPLSLDYITAPSPARYVLEIPSKYAKNLGIKTDWTLELQD